MTDVEAPLYNSETVGASVPGVRNKIMRVEQATLVTESAFDSFQRTEIERTEVAQQGFAAAVGSDPWEDLIKEHEASVDQTLAAADPLAHVRRLRTNEQNEVLGIFCDLLAGPTGDGGNKRARGEKPSWKVDPSHEGKAFGHLDKERYPERYDAESGCHHYVHAAWRLLATAYQHMVEDGLIPGDPK